MSAATPVAANMLTDDLRERLKQSLAQVNSLVLGKPQEVRLAFVALLSDGHLLIEDLPGLGKTTLAHALAATLGLGFQRVQFTSDLLFFVIATQNPVDLAGTYPLPDSQLDRFLLRLTLGYPGEDAERALLSGTDRRDLIAQAAPLLGAADVLALRRAAKAVHASEVLIGYVQALMTRSRQHPGVRVGLSPRAGIALLRAARAYALLLGRNHVLPDDVQALFAAVAAHRLIAEADAGNHAPLAKAILHTVPVD